MRRQEARVKLLTSFMIRDFATMMTNTLSLSDILNRLIFNERIRVTELSRRTGVPQATLQRMVMGTIENPRQASLQPIAEYFKVSLEQLKGIEPISWLSPAKLGEIGWAQVPLLSFEQAVSITEEKASMLNEGLLYTDAKVGMGAFALKMNDASMEPLFPQGTLLIIDPQKVAKDRSYVLAAIAGCPKAIFRQLLLDYPLQYLKPISPDFNRYNGHLIGDKDRIIGVVVQTRRDYED